MSKNVTISYNALPTQSIHQLDKDTTIISNDGVVNNSQLDIAIPSSTFTRRKSNFNDYNLEVVKKLEYYESSKSVIKGSCILDSNTYIKFNLYL